MKKKVVGSFLVVILLLLALFLPGFLVDSQELRMGGSTSVYPLFHGVSALSRSENFAYLYNSQGSSAAYKNVKSGNFLVGFISKEPTTQMKTEFEKQELAHFLLAKDLIVFLYSLPTECQLKDPNQNRLNLSSAELQAIFFQKQFYWNDLKDVQCSTAKKIYKISRENGSGTRTVFEEKILGFGNKQTNYQKYYEGIQKKSSGVILRDFKEKKNLNAISYISYFYRSKIKDLHQGNKQVNYASLDGLLPLATNYPLYRNFYGLYLPRNKSKLTAFFNFLQLSKFQKQVNQMGFQYLFTPF